MTVAELIAQLEELDQDAEVRLAFQPNYPLESTITKPFECEVNGRMRVYFAGETFTDYLPGEARRLLGWSR